VAPVEFDHTCSLGLTATRLSKHSGVIATIIVVTAREFGGEAGAFETHQALDLLRLPPVLNRHGVSLVLFPPETSPWGRNSSEVSSMPEVRRMRRLEQENAAVLSPVNKQLIIVIA